MGKLYRKKPIAVEVMQFIGTNWRDIEVWSDDSVYVRGSKLPDYQKEMEMTVTTLEGQVRARVGDYIIRGVRGEFYPCEKSIFEETYYEVTKEDGFNYGDS
jgi:hypothetical protein